ncbi:hypothetical protein [Nocardioides sp.]|uniref:hypothetical protein n=1 Tax=Nocardioides sp. TaxID=35761 RepID=UPI003564CE1B
MDLSNTIQPKSDQLDAIDLLTGDRTFTIERVSRNNDEQPINIHLAEFPRPWRPGLSMRRVLVACWGADAATYVGRRVTLYCDPDVEFGGAAVGGTRIRALSHMSKAKAVPLLVKRGRSAMFTVKPLADEEPKRIKPNVEALIENAQEARHNADLDDVARAAAGLTGDELDAVKAVVTARRAELKEAAELSTPNVDGPDGDWPTPATIPGATTDGDQ